MPIYLPPVHGISMSEALAEAAAIAPVDRAILRTYEVRHISLADPLRFVHNHEDIVATLEADAPLDPGDAVTFYASRISWGELTVSSDTGTPQATITVTNINGHISTVLAYGRGYLDVWTITERLYASNDLTGPAKLPPLTLDIVRVDMDGRSARLTCSFGDPVKLSVPKLTFKSYEYPGLSAR